MGNYYLAWNYSSALGGPWVEGEAVSIDEKLAKLINLDSPGVLLDREPEELHKYICPHCKGEFLGGVAYKVHKELCAEEHAYQPMSRKDFKALVNK